MNQARSTPDKAATDLSRAHYYSHKRYVCGIPRQPLPEGVVIVHNHVRPQRVINRDGFRVWTQPLTDTLERCDCKFGGFNKRDDVVHYRVNLKLVRERQEMACLPGEFDLSFFPGFGGKALYFRQGLSRDKRAGLIG